MVSFPRSGSRSAPPPSARPRAAGGRADSAAYNQVRERVQQRMLAMLSPTVTSQNPDEVRRTLERIFNEVVIEEGLPLSRAERADMLERIVADILGYGVLEPLLHDESITEVLVNGPDQIYIERNGMLESTDIRFRDADELMRIIDRIVSPLGRRVDESSPMVDARLPDGSRVNVIIPPLSLVGPCVSIRKFSRAAYSAEDMVRVGSMPREWLDFLRVCVQARLNIIVSGGTSTGKTTMLNVLSSFLPEGERIVTIEDAAELHLDQKHLVRLEARPPNVEGRGEVRIRQLVINALRMRPDRIVVGEVRGGEALDMLQAMNTGHDGSLTTAHSNSPRDTLHRIETMVLMAGMDLPLRAVREQIASAFNLVIHLARLVDGARKVMQVSEVQGMEGDVIVMQDLFRFVQTGVKNGQVEGYYTATGVRPKFMDKIEAAGLSAPPSTFAPSAQKKRW